jgi:DNA modification methylase
VIAADLEVLATPIADLSLLEGNPRRGDVEAVARSLAAFGQRKPIVARTDGTVIAGNHTLLAAKSLGWESIAVVRVDDDEATAKAFSLADNRTAELGGYDDAALAALIAEVHDADEELLAATGWDGDDLQDLLDRLSEPEPVAVAPRSYPDATGAAVVRADALAMPLATASVDLLISSPPYFALRSYQDEGEHYAGQLGSEPTPAEFLAALWAVMDEGWRVLKPGASAWINLGDKYAGSRMDGSRDQSGPARSGRRDIGSRESAGQGSFADSDVSNKSLMGLPWRFALGLCCPDQYRPGGGPQWTLRAEVIWEKKNSLPESVTDRVRRSHEQWFHLTKGERYFAGLDEVREAQSDPQSRRRQTNYQPVGGTYRESGRAAKDGGWNTSRMVNGVEYNPLGKLPGSVWSIPSQPLTVPDDFGVDHFAAFPAEWPRRIIDGWSPTGICTACGEPRAPVVERELRVDHVQARTRGRMDLNDDGSGRSAASSFGITDASIVGTTEATITGYRCGCEVPEAPTRPAVVLDPFGGTGTVAMMARAMGRYGVHLDLSRDYNRLACWRIFESEGGERCLAKAQD